MGFIFLYKSIYVFANHYMYARLHITYYLREKRKIVE